MGSGSDLTGCKQSKNAALACGIDPDAAIEGMGHVHHLSRIKWILSIVPVDGPCFAGCVPDGIINRKGIVASAGRTMILP